MQKKMKVASRLHTHSFIHNTPTHYTHTHTTHAATHTTHTHAQPAHQSPKTRKFRQVQGKKAGCVAFAHTFTDTQHTHKTKSRTQTHTDAHRRAHTHKHNLHIKVKKRRSLDKCSRRLRHICTRSWRVFAWQKIHQKSRMRLHQLVFSLVRNTGHRSIVRESCNFFQP